MSVLVCDKNGLLPVTALQCVNLSNGGDGGGKTVILAGCGPWLRVFTSSFNQFRVLLQVEMLPTKRIHGIRLVNNNCTPGEGKDGIINVLVFGNKVYRWISLTLEDTNVRHYDCSSLYYASDWILDIICLSFTNANSFEVAIALAHNGVIIFNSELSSKVILTSQVNCILLVLVSSWLLVASGTVFNEILLWGYKLPDVGTDLSPPPPPCDVSVRLKGHEGVIFCVEFNEELSLLASSSDDRTVRIWKLPDDWKLMKGVVLSTCLHVLYGHTARVWRVLWMQSSSLILSVGEDATCRVWGYHGNCKDVISGHRGRNIWSITVDEARGLVFTGGEDCSIRVSSLVNSSPSPPSTDSYCFVTQQQLVTTTSNPPSPPPSPRSLLLWDNSVLLCLFDDGSLYQLDVSSPLPAYSNWSPPCHVDPSYSKYCVMSSANGLSLLAVGNLEGNIKILSLPTVNVYYEWRSHFGKVFSLFWLGLPSTDQSVSTELLLSCGPAGEMVCWSVSLENDQSVGVSSLFTLVLPHSKHRWITTAIILSVERRGEEEEERGRGNVYHLVCGDRKGSIHYYCVNDWKKEKNNPRQSLFGVHGPNGVTQLLLFNDMLYSTGRDGYCRQYSIIKNEGMMLSELNRFHPVRGMDWIEGLTFTDNLGLLTTGFHGNEFLVYSSLYERHILTVTCGGGHRSYTISPLNNVENTIIFAYVKGPNVIVVRENLSDQLLNPVLQRSFVGREAVSLCLLNTAEESGTALFAVGSEDCSISLVQIDNNSKAIDSSISLSTVTNVTEHSSCVQSLSSVIINSESVLLFSGGGRASLKAWLVATSNSKDPTVVLQCEYNVHNLPSKPQRRKKGESACAPPECRITSLSSLLLIDINDKYARDLSCLVAGCSDSIIRIFIYNSSLKVFTLIKDVDYHHHCILSVTNITLPTTESSRKMALLLTAGTDGSILIWSLSSIVDEWYNGLGKEETKREDPALPVSVQPLLSIDQAHQSGINDMSVILIQESPDHSSLLIGSAGDDTGLTFCLCSVSCDCHVTLSRQVNVPSSHFSAVTGVLFLSSDSLLTTSVDQRLSLWSVSVSGSHLSVAKVTDHIHDVADPSCLVSYHVRNCCYGVVCGIGMECFKLV